MTDTPDLAADVDELATLWPALTAALARDSGTTSSERVTTASTEPTAPVNSDVLSTLATLTRDIPATARRVEQLLAEPHHHRDVPGHLRHVPRWHDRLTATNAAGDAAQLAREVHRWLDTTRRVIGLVVPDRELPEHCPHHDTPRAPLVVPGDRGWITQASGGYAVTWQHAEVILCRHCGATWTPSQYGLLGRLLRHAARRRATDHHTVTSTIEGAAA